MNNTISRSSSGVVEVLPLVEKENLEVVFFCDHIHDALCAKILLFLARSVARMEPVESGKITKPAMVCWHVHVVWLLRFNCHAGAQVGGDLETAASKNKDMKESGIRARCT